jgi:hypothetical protein
MDRSISDPKPIPTDRASRSVVRVDRSPLVAATAAVKPPELLHDENAATHGSAQSARYAKLPCRLPLFCRISGRIQPGLPTMNFCRRRSGRRALGLVSLPSIISGSVRHPTSAHLNILEGTQDRLFRRCTLGAEMALQVASGRRLAMSPPLSPWPQKAHAESTEPTSPAGI